MKNLSSLSTEVKTMKKCFIVSDDSPICCQTVYDCNYLFKSDKNLILKQLMLLSQNHDNHSLFYILNNTRTMITPHSRGLSKDSPLVLHGAFGLPVPMVHKTIDLGISKFNMNTDLRSASINFIQQCYQ